MVLTVKKTVSSGQSMVYANKAKKALEEKNNEIHKKRFEDIISKKMRTAFIGALDAFEKNFGHLWGHGQDSNELTSEQAQYRKIWEDTRTAVLNNGNTQLRAAKSEISQHLIHWQRYHTQLTVKQVDVVPSERIRGN